MRENMVMYGVKLQSAEDTPEVALTTSDFKWVLSSSSVQPDVGFGELDLIGGGFDQPSSVVGRQKAEIEMGILLKNYGTGITPEAAVFWKGAGFAEIEQNGYYQYSFDSTSTDALTIWRYSGNKTTNSCLIEKVGNVKLGWKIDLDFMNEVYGKATFNGGGRYTAAPVVGTQPTITKNRQKVPGLRNVTVSINGLSYLPINISIDGGQQVNDQVDATDSTGVGRFYITDQKISFSCKVYKDTTNIPYTNLLAGTEAPISVEWGSGTKVQVYMGYCQLKKATTSFDNGIEVYDLEGQCSRNDFKIRYLGGDASSSSSSSSS